MAINNKKGILRTLEAAIAIMLLLGFLFVVIPEPDSPTGEIPFEIRNTESFILQEMSFDNAIRSCVMASTPGECNCQGIDDLLDTYTPSGFGVSCEICKTSVSCTQASLLNLPLEKAVYTDSIFITKKRNARVVRLYFYES